MNKLIIFSLILSLAAATSPSVRFVNQVEGSTLTVYSNAISTFSLDYMASTNYYPIEGGQLMVTNILDQNGNSLNDGNSLLLSFGSFATIALVKIGNTFTPVQLNETVDPNMPMNDVSKAYVRMIDLGQGVQYVSFAAVSGSLSAYTGFLVATPFKEVSPSINEFRIFDSQSGTYNTPILKTSVTLQAGKVYTYFFFTPTNTVSGYLAYDHDVDGSINIPTQPSTTQAQPTQATTGTVSNTPSTPVTSGVIVGTPVNNHEHSGASKMIIGSIFALIVLLL
jgi:hypothetical protein